MSRKTAETKELVQRVLRAIPNHNDPDIIELVFLEIENNPVFYRDYLDLQKIFS
jgi:hypothetical protein